MSNLKDKDVERLLSLAETAKRDGGSLSKAFSVFAKEKNLAKGTVRNTYYEILKRAKTDEAFNEKFLSCKNLKAEKIIQFDQMEARWLLKKILIGATFGKSIRRTISELTDEPKKALRYQNKYRNMLKKDKELVEDVLSEIKTEYGKSFNPYGIKRDDAVLARLKSEINDLYARIAQNVREENQRLKSRLAFLESENERLRGKSADKGIVKDYFGENSKPKFIGGGIHKK